MFNTKNYEAVFHGGESRERERERDYPVEFAKRSVANIPLGLKALIF